jgi:hypothetical protein
MIKACWTVAIGLAMLTMGSADPALAQGADEFSINPGLSGSWANPDIPGQGIFLDVDPEFGVIFLAWFTYQEETEGSSAVIGYPKNQWLVAQGRVEPESSGAILDIIRTEGGLFDDPMPVSQQTVGRMDLNFLDCTEAWMDFAFDDGSAQGHLQLTRITSAEVCETLAATE